LTIAENLADFDTGDNVPINFGPHQIGPAAWERVTADGATGIEALCDWFELTAQITDMREAVDQIDAVVCEFHYEMGETEPSEKSGAQPNHGEKLWGALISKYAEKLCALGLTPHQTAAAMGITLDRMYRTMFPKANVGDVIDMVAMIEAGATSGEVAAEFDYGIHYPKNIRKRLSLRGPKIEYDLYDETPRGLSAEPDLRLLGRHDIQGSSLLQNVNPW
jgi:hypothetical protein